MRSHLFGLSSAALAAVLVAVLDHRLAERNAPPMLEVVDLQQLLTEQVAEVGRQKLSADQQHAAATTYAAALNEALEAVARADHAVLLVKPAALIGAADATDRVRTLIRMGIDARTRSPAAPISSNP
jgi:type-F conjugative transfer system protein TrbI